MLSTVKHRGGCLFTSIWRIARMTAKLSCGRTFRERLLQFGE